MARRQRTPPPAPRIAVTAAATKINLGNLPTKSPSRNPDAWQGSAWAFHDTVPEVGFATQYTGNAMSKLRLYAAVYPQGADPDADPIPVIAYGDAGNVIAQGGLDTALAMEAQRIVEGIRSMSGGQAEILHDLNVNLEVAAEAYLVHWAERPILGFAPDADPMPEHWEVHSADAYQVRDKKAYIKMFPEEPPDKQRMLIDGGDTQTIDEAIRIWTRHPRWKGVPWAPIASCLPELQLLNLLSGELQAESMSRHNAGILFINGDAEVDSKPVNDPDGDEAEDDRNLTEELVAALTAPIADPSNAASVVPVVVRVNGTVMDKIALHVKLERQSTDLDAKIKARLDRLARGINLPVERVMGLMQTTFANAGQVDEDEFEDYLEPRAKLTVQGLTFAVLQPDLAATFPLLLDQVRRVVCWYDASALVSQPDPAESATEGYRLGLLRNEAWLRSKGWDLSDGTTPEEQAAILDLLSPGQPAPPGGPTETAGALPAPLPAARAIEARYTLAAAGRRNIGPKLLAIDSDLRARLLGLADAKMSRALERAANVIRSKASSQQRATLGANGWGPAHAALLAAGKASADEILTDAFAEMETKFLSWGATAQASALDAVSKAVSGLSTAERAAIKARQAADLGEAWSWLEATLTTLAKAKLYNPDEVVPAVGELAGTSVPPGIVRSAMAQAGGATGLVIDEGRGVWLPLSHGASRPAGGIATGELMMDTAIEHNATRDGYVWVYGPAARTRPFDPHAELDGVEFVNFDDDVLSNPDSFPEFAYYMPGDHPGCICDFEVILLAVE